MYSNVIILLHGNFRHAHIYHKRDTGAGLQKPLPPRAWLKATRNPVLSNPGPAPAGTSPKESSLLKNGC